MQINDHSDDSEGHLAKATSCMKGWVRLNEGENQITGCWSHTGSLHLNSEMEFSIPKPSPPIADKSIPHPPQNLLPFLKFPLLV